MILLDTHVVLRLALEPEALSRRAAAAIEEQRRLKESLAIADITLYEIATLSHRKRVILKLPLERFLEGIELQFITFRMSPAICFQAASFPPDYPGDPVDRIIGGTALVHKLKLVTADDRIRRSSTVPTIW